MEVLLVKKTISFKIVLPKFSSQLNGSAPDIGG
jgi:hypothetical protein